MALRVGGRITRGRSMVSRYKRINDELKRLILSCSYVSILRSEKPGWAEKIESYNTLLHLKFWRTRLAGTTHSRTAENAGSVGVSRANRCQSYNRCQWSDCWTQTDEAEAKVSSNTLKIMPCSANRMRGVCLISCECRFPVALQSVKLNTSPSHVRLSLDTHTHARKHACTQANVRAHTHTHKIAREEVLQYDLQSTFSISCYPSACPTIVTCFKCFFAEQ